MTTIREVLTDARARFAAVSSSPGLDAQLLLAEVLDASRAHVLAYPEQALTGEQAAAYARFVARRAAGEPVAYLLGRRAFYDREFSVGPGVLIPRPETEHLLEAALAFVRERADQGDPVTAAVDVGTGSGALAVTLAAHAPQTRVWATDISPQALTIARHNAERNAVHVTFLEGDLLEPLLAQGVQVDLVMANLPYIATAEMLSLEVSRYEPHLALDGGPDGLDLIRRLLIQAPAVINPGALILLEIGADQGESAARLARDAFPGCQCSVMKDYAGHDRVVILRPS